MEINKISSVRNQNFTSNVKNTQNPNVSESIENGDKKLKDALGALAAINTPIKKTAEVPQSITEDLKNIGLTQRQISKLVKDYYNTDEYEYLVNGDDDGDKWHTVEIERNLTPAEAIVYQAYGMDSYYCAIGANGLEDASIPPLDLVKTMLSQEVDLVAANMLLSGKIHPETAEMLKKIEQGGGIWTEWIDNGDSFGSSATEEIAIRESGIILIDKNLDKMTSWLDKDKSAEMGLIRPLKPREAEEFVIACNKNDVETINKYIKEHDEAISYLDKCDDEEYILLGGLGGGFIPVPSNYGNK